MVENMFLICNTFNVMVFFNVNIVKYFYILLFGNISGTNVLITIEYILVSIKDGKKISGPYPHPCFSSESILKIVEALYAKLV